MRRNVVRSSIAHLVLGFFAFTALFPLALVLINSFKTNQEILQSPFSLPSVLALDNFATAWEYGGFSRGFVNSLLLTGTTVLVVLACSSLAGYVLAGRKVGAWPVIMVYLTMAMTVPVQLFIFPLYSAVAAMNLLDSPVAVGVIQAAINMPFATFLMRTFFLNIPDEIEEAAFVDGVNTWQLIVQVLLPMVRPGMVTVGVIVGLNAWNEFLISSTFLQDPESQTLTLGFLSMNGTFSTELGTMMAGALILIVPILTMFVLLQRQVIDGMASGAVKG